jgi:hypothetical protein
LLRRREEGNICINKEEAQSDGYRGRKYLEMYIVEYFKRL